MWGGGLGKSTTDRGLKIWMRKTTAGPNEAETPIFNFLIISRIFIKNYINTRNWHTVAKVCSETAFLNILKQWRKKQGKMFPFFRILNLLHFFACQHMKKKEKDIQLFRVLLHYLYLKKIYWFFFNIFASLHLLSPWKHETTKNNHLFRVLIQIPKS